MADEYRFSQDVLEQWFSNNASPRFSQDVLEVVLPPGVVFSPYRFSQDVLELFIPVPPTPGATGMGCTVLDHALLGGR